MLIGQAIRAGQEWAFAASISSEARPYADVILRAANEVGVDPFALAAIGQRESNWGRQLRPDLTGDCAKRSWTIAGVPVTKSSDGLYFPADGLCWGRGLLQIDYGYHYGWIAGNNWRDPYTNVMKGASILRGMFDYFAAAPKTPTVTLTTEDAKRRGVAPGVYPDPRPLSGSQLSDAAIAAYNGGTINVLKSIAAGVSPSVTTTGGNYGSRVLGEALAMAQSFASRVGVA